MEKNELVSIIDGVLANVDAELKQQDSSFLKEKLENYYKSDIQQIREKIIDDSITLHCNCGYGFVRSLGEWDGFSDEFEQSMYELEHALRSYAKKAI